MRPGAPLSPGLIPARPGPAGALLRPGAPLSPGLIPNRIGDPEGAPMRPGAPLSPGLVSKTRDPEMRFTSAVWVSQTFFSQPPAAAQLRAVSALTRGLAGTR